MIELIVQSAFTMIAIVLAYYLIKEVLNLLRGGKNGRI